MANLAALLEKSASTYADRTAIVFGDTRLSYAQVDGAANQVANLLVSRGVQPGDKVALSCPNLPYFTIVYYGILKAGATVVPLNVLLKGREVAYHLDDSDAVAYFAFEGTPDLPIGEAAWEGFQAVDGCKDFFLIKLDSAAPEPLEPPEYYAPLVAQQPPTFETVETDDDDTAVILYTSGTTGQPKGAELRHRNMRDNALAGADLFGADADRPDTYLCVLPLFHSFGQTCIQNGSMAFGGTVVMLPRFEAQAALGLMLKEKVTYFAGVPTMYWGLLGALDDSVDVEAIAASLRVAAAGGSALPVDIHRQFKDRFGVTILEGYGLTETTAALTVNLPGSHKIGTVGRPLPGTAVRVADDGELLFRGGQVFAGYWGNEAATAETLERDGWFHSGDVGEVDDEGFVRITGRKKEILVTAGGKNVAPAVLEDRVRAHALVDQCLVVGDGQPFIGALVTLDREALTVWAQARGLSGSAEDLLDHADVRAAVEEAVEDANKAVSKAESIRKFVVIADEWTEEGGQLTPSLKLRRSVVMRESRGHVEALYR